MITCADTMTRDVDGERRHGVHRVPFSYLLPWLAR
jgi:hypothetical protein